MAAYFCKLKYILENVLYDNSFMKIFFVDHIGSWR